MSIRPNEFECAACHHVFTKDRPEEEAVAEHDKQFPGSSIETAVLVCDPCYKKLNLNPDEPILPLE